MRSIQDTKQEAYRAFAGRFTHEISQPLTVIAAYVSGCICRLADNNADKERIIEVLKAVNHQVERARDVIHHMNEIIDQQER